MRREGQHRVAWLLKESTTKSTRERPTLQDGAKTKLVSTVRASLEHSEMLESATDNRGGIEGLPT